MKRLLTALFALTLMTGCSDNEEAQSIIGAWCIDQSLSVYQLTFSEDKIFTSSLKIIEEFVIEHGIWTVRDNELIIKIGTDGGEQDEALYSISVRKNNLRLIKKNEDSVNSFTYLAGLTGDDPNEISLTRCE